MVCGVCHMQQHYNGYKTLQVKNSNMQGKKNQQQFVKPS